MKKGRIILFLTFLMLIPMTIDAQIMYPQLDMKGRNLYADGVKMHKENLAALEGFDLKSYSNGRGKTTAGIVLMSVGGFNCAVAAWCIIDANISRNKNPDIPTSGLEGMAMLYFSVSGILLEAIGCTLYLHGKSAIRQSAKSYNESVKPVVILEPAREGIGLALRF